MLSLVISVLPWVLTVLLFSTARRGNHWAGVHDLVSGTRVVQRNLLQSAVSAELKAPPVDLARASMPSMQIGPYVVQATVGETGGGRLLVGIDPILRRHVWIHDVPAGTPPVDATRRDVARSGRLHWLAGRRSATENWDAFEAPRGEPFLAAPALSEWSQVERALSSLATELDASAQEGRDTRRSLAHVWRRPDGRLVLLDVAWPMAAADAHPLSPVELLAAVSTRAVAFAEPAAPLSATRLLNRLASGAKPSLPEIKAELRRLTSLPSRPSRVRRALPMVMAAAPVAILVVIAVVMIPLFAESFLDDRPSLMMWMTWIADSGSDAALKTPEQRTAAEQYVAAHFRSQLTSDVFWNTQVPQIEPFLRMRRTAAEIAARYPVVSPEELARATEVLAPQLQEMATERAQLRANFRTGAGTLRDFISSGFPAVAVLASIVFSLLSALAVPGGLVTRALGHAVVRRDGREIGRIRSAVRLLVAWSPALAWIAYAGLPMFGTRAMSPAVAALGGSLAMLVIAAGAVWTLVVPGRGPHDRIVGTWVVPR
jgi:hypothetical protein